MVAPAWPAGRARTTQAGSLGSSADTVRASGGAPSAWTEQKGSISAGARDGLQQSHDDNYPSRYGRSAQCEDIAPGTYEINNFLPRVLVCPPAAPMLTPQWS